MSPSRPTASSAGGAENSAVVKISEAGRARLAAEANATASNARAAYDTSQGSKALDIDAYFTPDPSRSLLSIPLLLPTQNNIDALSRQVAAKMPGFLAAHGIPEAPASISYDAYGQMQLPIDYRYAEQFRAAMSENPVLARQLSTVSALSSQMTGMEKAMSFDADYRAAKTPAEVEAVIAKYRHILFGNAPAATIALHFDGRGRLSVTADGQAL
jgi:hypothetical protein